MKGHVFTRRNAERSGAKHPMARLVMQTNTIGNLTMSLTIDQNGKALAETVEGITLPVDCSFEKVNGWVHGADVQFEELQALCLGMASENDRLREKLGHADYLVGAFERGCDPDEYALNIYDYRQV